MENEVQNTCESILDASMSFSTLINRDGTLMVHNSLMTEEVWEVLVYFDKENDGLLDQNDLLCAAGFVQDELETSDCILALATAILFNAKKYLITDKAELVSELVHLDIDIFEDCRGCWRPASSTDLQMYWVARK